ncbi:hypothetical protein PFISCL1PPCAC_29242, partial [Pristionchus fissidentatus]
DKRILEAWGIESQPSRMLSERSTTELCPHDASSSLSPTPILAPQLLTLGRRCVLAMVWTDGVLRTECDLAHLSCREIRAWWRGRVGCYGQHL